MGLLWTLLKWTLLLPVTLFYYFFIYGLVFLSKLFALVSKLLSASIHILWGGVVWVIKSLSGSFSNHPNYYGRSRSIPEDVKTYVWRRDQGRCVRCGSQVNIEFDHIIPFSRGGSNTARAQ